MSEENNKSSNEEAVERFLKSAKNVGEDDKLNKAINIIQALDIVDNFAEDGQQNKAYNQIREIIGALDMDKYNQIIELVESVEVKEDDPLVYF